MNTLIVVAQKALPVFVMLALGMLCRKTKMISREGVAAMKTFAVNITLPPRLNQSSIDTATLAA